MRNLPVTNPHTSWIGSPRGNWKRLRRGIPLLGMEGRVVSNHDLNTRRESHMHMKFTEFIKGHVSGIYLVSLGVLASLLTGGLHGKLLLGGVGGK